ncbi:recQ-like DNA helicase Blm isoform X2 [Wyeomyia smithii]|uniref:recQ-like DNA helicase Blm isoform X2 n=1 Tax=Wyeomyia smithii TaxID=174621 RepID=UPI002467AFE0|nr:recQ-like DNA helicase Blm isoform X2 [Wyeomyia smithii]
MSRKALFSSTEIKHEPKRQTSLMSFITQKKLDADYLSCNHIAPVSSTISKEDHPDSSNKIKTSDNYFETTDEDAKLRSPSVFKRKFPKTKQSNTIEILSSDSDISPEKLKNKVSLEKHKVKNEPESVTTSEKLELNLENDSNYQKATKKLNENLAKISPQKTCIPKSDNKKSSKFEYKVPKASLLSSLSEPLNKTIDLNVPSPASSIIDKPTLDESEIVSSTPKRAPILSLKQKSILSTANDNIKHQEQQSSVSMNNGQKIQLKKALTSKDTVKSTFSKNELKHNSTGVFQSLPTESTSGALDRLLSPSKYPSIKFDPTLNDKMVEILNNPRFKTTEVSETELKNTCRYLHETNQLLLEKFYNIFAQLPEQFFSLIEGFQLDTYSKLKSLIENTRGKIKVNEKALENFQKLKVSSSRSHKTCTETIRTGKLSYSPVDNDVENNIVNGSSSLKQSNETPLRTSGFVFKKPMFNTNLNKQEENKSIELDAPREDSEEEEDIESIMERIREAELINNGRANQQNISTINLATPESSCKPTSEPRITFSAKETCLRNTQFIENVETQVDDDGWQVYDPSQFDDPESIVIADASERFESAASFHQKNNQLRDASLGQLLKDVGESQIERSTGKDKSQQKPQPLGNFHSGVRNDGTTGEFDGMSYPHSNRLQIAFRETFGLRSFRPNQLQVINATLLGNDCFVLMPTGGGKSLCYQLPALLTEGVTIVVSPLKSLILDQVNKLSSLDIPAAHLSGDVSYADQQKIYNDLQSPQPILKLLYVTPEKISSSARFQNILTGLYRMKKLGRFVIDEAHCVSAWGHDFRPDYKKLAVLRQQFPSVPIMALTATANPRVRIDVLKQLNLTRNTKWFLCSFNRPNLKYIIRPKQGVATKTEIIELIKKKFPRSTGIIYCLSKKDCDQLSTELRQSGIKAKSYHAGLSDTVRESTQKDWITDKIKVVCATIAFGMGIDKPDVRYVIHHSMPKSIEGYYQEAGRAGRDGEIATCVLFYNYSDMLRYRKMMDHDSTIPFDAKQVHLHNLFRMVNYCENVTDCRRTQQLDYFAEHFTREQCLENRTSACDNCLMQGEYKTVDVTDDCIAIGKCVRDLCAGRNRFTLLHLVEVFKGSEQKKIIENNHHRTPYHGRLKSWDRSDIQRLMHKLVIEDYLKEDLIFCNDIPQAYIKIGGKIEKLMNREIRVNFSVKEKVTNKRVQQIDIGNDTKRDNQSNAQRQELQERCYNDLLDICRSLAAEKNVTLASVMNMQALKAMSERLPETQAEMLALPHVTKANFEKYGQQLLEITQNYAAEKLCLMLDSDCKANNSEDECDGSSSDDVTDWGRLAREASTGGDFAGPSGKRKRSWGSGSRGKKRFRSRTKSKTAPRGKAAATRGGKVTKRGSGATSSRGARAGAAGFGLLPLPGNR